MSGLWPGQCLLQIIFFNDSCITISFALLSILECAVACIQSYVFTMLRSLRLFHTLFYSYFIGPSLLPFYDDLFYLIIVSIAIFW